MHRASTHRILVPEQVWDVDIFSRLFYFIVIVGESSCSPCSRSCDVFVDFGLHKSRDAIAVMSALLESRDPNGSHARALASASGSLMM